MAVLTKGTYLSIFSFYTFGEQCSSSLPYTYIYIYTVLYLVFSMYIIAFHSLIICTDSSCNMFIVTVYSTLLFSSTKLYAFYISFVGFLVVFGLPLQNLCHCLLALCYELSTYYALQPWWLNMLFNCTVVSYCWNSVYEALPYICSHSCYPHQRWIYKISQHINIDKLVNGHVLTSPLAWVQGL